MINEQKIDEHLAQLPLRPTWLEMVVNFLDEIPSNKAHVRLIARDIPRERQVDATEETIYRTINNHCPDAKDFSKGDPEYFSRVEPGVYQLVKKPSRAEIWNLKGRVEEDDWTDYGHWRVWESFVEEERKKHGEKWMKMSTAERLAAFAQNLDSFKPQIEIYNKYKNSSDDLTF